MSQRANFTPYANYTISASTTSANTNITSPSSGEPITDLLISNSTAGVAFVRWGTGTQTAVATDFAVLPGVVMCVSLGVLPNNVAVLLSAGTGNVYISTGRGN